MSRKIVYKVYTFPERRGGAYNKILLVPNLRYDRPVI